jgi:hypothetical protein
MAQTLWIGEKKLVVMFGGLHTELAALKATGKWIWTSALVQPGITSSGTAVSFLKASHVSKISGCTPDYSKRS